MGSGSGVGTFVVDADVGAKEGIGVGSAFVVGADVGAEEGSGLGTGVGASVFGAGVGSDGAGP